MKKILSFIIFVISIVFLTGYNTTNASLWEDLIEGSKPKINVDCATEDCSLTTGTQLVRDTINDIEKDRPFSEYIQDIVAYLLTFISIIAVIYIIYAGFIVLTAAGDEEKIKKTKSTILHVIIGIVLIWLAYPITIFIIRALNVSS